MILAAIADFAHQALDQQDAQAAGFALVKFKSRIGIRSGQRIKRRPFICDLNLQAVGLNHNPASHRPGWRLIGVGIAADIDQRFFNRQFQTGRLRRSHADNLCHLAHMIEKCRQVIEFGRQAQRPLGIGSEFRVIGNHGICAAPRRVQQPLAILLS